MAFFIYRDTKFEEALESLRKDGGKGLFAVKKVEEIIKKLTSQENRLHHAGKLTKRGEHRIRYCRKYELCSGYRLITVQNENYLILSYAGKHDDCDRWLERNKGLNYDIVEIEPELFGSNGYSSADKNIAEDVLPEDIMEEEICVREYEQALAEKLNDSSVQKIIFSWFKR